MAMGYPNPDEIEITIATLLIDEMQNKASDESIIRESIKTAHGVDFIPSSIALADVENLLINTMSRDNVLNRFLKKIKDNYDYILIDCLPSLNLLTVNALTASDSVIIPVQAQYFSAKGLESLLETITAVRKNLNPNLRIAGALITMLDKRSSGQEQIIDIISASYGSFLKVYNSIIPLSVKVSDNQSKGLTMVEESKNAVSKAYQELALEVI